jgi:PTS system sucrose-specific IIC component
MFFRKGGQMDNFALAQAIIAHLAGKENIFSLAHCMTRLRVQVKNLDKIDMKGLMALDGVLNVQIDDTLQVVLGPGRAHKVCRLMETLMNAEIVGETSDESVMNWQDNKATVQGKIKSNVFKQTLKLISAIFIPLIPAIIAAGLFNGFANLLSMRGGENATLQLTALFFRLIGGSFMVYFAIYVGFSSARQFEATEALGGMIGAITIMPLLTEMSKTITMITSLSLYNAEVPLSSVLITGKGGIIGVILGVWVLSVVEKKLHQWVPDVLDLIVTPFLSLLVSAVVLVGVMMPLAGVFSDGLIWVLELIIASPFALVRILSGYILAALFLPMVLLGLHHGLIPIYAVQLEQMGYVTLFAVLCMGGAGQVGASIAIYLKAKKVGNHRLQKVVSGALPAGVLGVGEPLIYGVTLPLGKPFITAGLGAGFGGAWVMLSGVATLSWGPAGVAALPLMNGYASMINYMIGLLIAYTMGFIITYIFLENESVRAV